MIKKGLKWGIAGLIVGQAIALFASKPGLKSKLANAQGTDKIKLVFDELVSFNKGLYDSVDLSTLKSDLAFRMEHLQEDITDLTNNWSQLSQDKLAQWTTYLQTTTEQLKSDVITYVQDLDEQHNLTDKLSVLGDHIATIKSNITGAVDQAKEDVKNVKDEVKSAAKDVAHEAKKDTNQVANHVKDSVKKVAHEAHKSSENVKQNAQIIKKNVDDTTKTVTK